MTFNIDDYLSEERKAEIAEEMFRDRVRDELRKPGNLDRIMSNISYYAVFQEVDAAVENGGETLRELIRERAFKVINKGSNYDVFRSKTAWSDASAATKIVEELLQEKRDLIRDRVTQVINDMPFDRVKDEIRYVMRERIDNILAGLEEE